MAESLIWSEEELKKFYDMINMERDLSDVDFFCLASRRKYLNAEEKYRIKMGDTVMLCKTVLKDYNWPKFLSKIRQADAMAEFVLDSNDNYIPKKCFVMYMNVNHTSVVKAIREFKETMAGWDADTMTLLEHENTEKRANLLRQYKSCTEGILKAFQNPKNGRDEWIDIDCDIEGDESHREDLANKVISYFSDRFYDEMTQRIFSHIAILTHGGFHFLIRKNAISAYNREVSRNHLPTDIWDYIFTPEGILNRIRRLLKDEKSKEIVINTNKMVPIPGTLQGGFKVRMLS